MTTPQEQQTTYTQVIDEKTGEIKYVPNNPPKENSDGEPGEGEGGGAEKFKDSEGHEISKGDMDLFDGVRKAIDSNTNDKLTSLLKTLEDNNKRLRYSKRLQNGKLDVRRLTAYKTSDRLFKKKAIKHKDYQFTFLIDTSGSMFHADKHYPTTDESLANSKMKVAFESVIKVVKSLEELKIPSAVIAMNQETRLLKEFSSMFLMPDFMRRAQLNVLGLHKGDNNTGGTNEMVCYKETMAYIERNSKPRTVNVVFVISDGEPGGNNGDIPVYMEDETCQFRNSTGGDDHTSTLKKYWERQDSVLVYGLGIRSPAKQIPRAKQIEDTSQLPEILSNLIQEIIL